jgi:hypothetical protein
VGGHAIGLASLVGALRAASCSAPELFVRAANVPSVRPAADTSISVFFVRWASARTSSFAHPAVALAPLTAAIAGLSAGVRPAFADGARRLTVAIGSPRGELTLLRHGHMQVGDARSTNALPRVPGCLRRHRRHPEPAGTRIPRCVIRMVGPSRIWPLHSMPRVRDREISDDQ